MRPAYTLPFAFTLALTILLTAGAVSAAETSEHACACPEHALYHPDNLAGHHDKPAFPARTAYASRSPLHARPPPRTR